jgi:hypothetical protein
MHAVYRSKSSRNYLDSQRALHGAACLLGDANPVLGRGARLPGLTDKRLLEPCFRKRTALVSWSASRASSLYEEQPTGTERSGTGEQEGRRPQNRLKTLSKLHELFANFAQRITKGVGELFPRNH